MSVFSLSGFKLRLGHTFISAVYDPFCYDS